MPQMLCGTAAAPPFSRDIPVRRSFSTSTPLSVSPSKRLEFLTSRRVASVYVIFDIGPHHRAQRPDVVPRLIWRIAVRLKMTTQIVDIANSPAVAMETRELDVQVPATE